MTLKKKLGSKLANSVRQVKSQREQNPTVVSAKIVPAVKQTATPASAKVIAQPVAPRAAQPQAATGRETRPATNLDSLHPRRVWPD